MNRNMILVGVVGVAIGFTVGRVSYMSSNEVVMTVESEELTKQTNLRVTTNAENKLSQQTTRSTKHRVRPPVSSILADLESLLENESSWDMDIELRADAYDLVKNLDENELEDTLALIAEDPDLASQSKYLKLILGRYAELNASGAMAYYESNIPNRRTKMVALQAIMSSWVKQEPDKAFEWYKTKDQEGAIQGNYSAEIRSLGTIFKGLAEQDLEASIAQLGEVNIAGYKGTMAGYGITSVLKEKEDFELFFEKTQDLGSQEVRSSALRSWVNRNPEEAAEWSMNLEDENQRAASSKELLKTWINKDADKAIDWYMNNSTKSAEENMMQVVQSWTYQDPAATSKWLEGQGAAVDQKVVERFVDQSSWNNPAIAATWLDKISDEKRRNKKLKSIYRNWARQDVARADEFLDSYANADEIRKSLKPKLQKKLKF